MSAHSLLGLLVWTAGTAHCIHSMYQWVSQGAACKAVFCLNPHSFAVAMDDDEFLQALKASDWLVPDGVGIHLAAKLLGVPVEERTTGSDVFYELSHVMNSVGDRSVFFLGSTPRTLQRITSRYSRQFPNVRIAGTFAPPFYDRLPTGVQNECLAEINAASPDVVFVGMTAPKQELLIAAILEKAQCRIAVGIGAVFDYYANEGSRPSSRIRKLGLEWLVRLILEPRRLWRRTFASAPRFILAVMKARARA